ncbi:DNA ligase LigA-related protein [Microbispora rosea]|uniref:DNA ligase LigA-related protein n=1 Tax=Microbispora rosea TaxID=58117 RepID=UPI0037B46A4C
MAELINRRRRQVLVHSILYYDLDSPLITDGVFDEWARQLAQLQTEHPAISCKVAYRWRDFADFDGSTGYHLPLHDPHARSRALGLLAYARRERLRAFPH